MVDNLLSDDQLRNRIFYAVKPAAALFLKDRAETRDLRVGEVVLEDGAEVTHVIFPHTGVISILVEADDGRTVEKSSIGNEGFVGFTFMLGGGTSVGRCVVQIAGRASWISIPDLEEGIQQYHCVQDAMLRYAKSHIVQLMESCACNRLHNSGQRVARWLLHTHDRVDGNSFYVTQEALAALLYMRRATVNAICSDLMNAGAITYHRGSMTVTNRATLRAHACDCYDRIREAALPSAPEPVG